MCGIDAINSSSTGISHSCTCTMYNVERYTRCGECGAVGAFFYRLYTNQMKNSNTVYTLEDKIHILSLSKSWYNGTMTGSETISINNNTINVGAISSKGDCIRYE